MSRQNKDNLSLNILERQKRTIKHAAFEFLAVAIILLALAIIALIVGLSVEDPAHSKRIIFLATPTILFVSLVFVFLFLWRFVIYSKLNKIKDLTEQSITITCKKVKFLFHPVSRNISVIICIIFVDYNGTKYYYITRENNNRASKNIKSKLVDSQVNLVCYKNSNFIKSY